MPFSISNFEQHLMQMRPTEAGIRTMAKWMLVNHRNAVDMVRVWDAEFRAATASRKPTFLHLVNEILQSDSEEKQTFQDEFGDILVSAFSHAMSNSRSDQEKHKIARIVQVLSDRKVLSEQLLQDLAIEVDLPAHTSSSSRRGRRSDSFDSAPSSFTSDDEDDQDADSQHDDESQSGFNSQFADDLDANLLSDVGGDGSGGGLLLATPAATIPVPTVRFPANVRKVFDQLQHVKDTEAADSSFREQIRALNENLNLHKEYREQQDKSAAEKPSPQSDSHVGATQDESAAGAESNANNEAGAAAVKEEEIEYDEEEMEIDITAAMALLQRYRSHLSEKVTTHEAACDVLETFHAELESKQRRTATELADFSRQVARLAELRRLLSAELAERKAHEIKKKAAAAAAAKAAAATKAAAASKAQASSASGGSLKRLKLDGLDKPAAPSAAGDALGTPYSPSMGGNRGSAPPQPYSPGAPDLYADRRAPRLAPAASTDGPASTPYSPSAAAAGVSGPRGLPASSTTYVPPGFQGRFANAAPDPRAVQNYGASYNSRNYNYVPPPYGAHARPPVPYGQAAGTAYHGAPPRDPRAMGSYLPPANATAAGGYGYVPYPSAPRGPGPAPGSGPAPPRGGYGQQAPQPRPPYSQTRRPAPQYRRAGGYGARR